MDTIIADGADSDVSTDNGADDMMVVTEAVHLSPCPWIKLAHDLLVKAFSRSNFFICHRVVDWQCFRRSEVRQYLQLDNETNELTRADVKAFLRVQEGNLRAEEVYMQCKWTRLSLNLLHWKFRRSNPFMCVQIPSVDSRWSCRRLRSVLIHNVHPQRCYRAIRAKGWAKDEDWEDVWNDDAEVAGPTPAGFFPCRISGNGSASGSL